MAPISSNEEGRSPVLTAARMFSLRIVHLDYYMTAPLPGMDDCYSHFQGHGVLQVPVVRIFGSTISGQKTCLHLHKAFPYFYVSYDEDLPQEVNEALAYVRRMASALEKALKIASSTGAKRQHVHSCSLVRGRKYYGYYPNEQLFVKIVLYYPQELSRMSTLLLSGGIMNHKFQPYEAHIPYLLQILIDYNLYGMGHLHISSLKFRNPLPGGPSDLTSSVKLVKSEFLHKRMDSAGEAQNPHSLQLNIAPFKESVSEKKQVDTTLDLSTQRKVELPSTCPGIDPVSSGSHHSTPVTGSQPDLWLRGTVPEEWIWPVLASSQGQCPYSKQSTCELEADTSVQDILNRRELLFRPLQQTGPEVKMVQSLTPIWEEELLRSGEDGPAGPVNPQYQSTAHIVPPTPSLEQVMRDVLFQIVNAEEHQVGFRRDWQDCTPDSNPGTRTTGELIQNAEEEVKALTAPGSNQILLENRALEKQPKAAPPLPETAAARENLLQCTQVANGEHAFISPELSCEPISISKFQLVAGGSSKALRNQQVFDEAYAPKQAALIDDNDEIAINEEAVKSHISQRLQSQELDKEAAEFLRWLGTTQDAEDSAHKDNGEEIALTQFFSSPGMDSALLKALADYESATNQECQAILDCAFVNEEEEHEEVPVDMDATGGKLAQFKTDKEVETGLSASTSTASGRHGTHILKRKNDQKAMPAHIPQADGTCDEEDLEDKLGHDEPFFPLKKPRVDPNSATAVHSHLDGKSRKPLHRPSAEESKEVSVRELMRRRRERQPRKKEMSCSPSSLSENTMDEVEQGNLKKIAGDILRSEELQGTRRKSMKGMLEEQVAELSPKVEPRRKTDSLATTRSRPAEKHIELEKKGKDGHVPDQKNRVKNIKYMALPMVKVKNEHSQVDAPIQYLDKRDAETHLYEPSQTLSSAEQVSETKSLQGMLESSVVNSRLAPDVKKEDSFSAASRGDDRDCGGGHGPSTVSCKELGKQWASDGSSEGWPGGPSRDLQTSEVFPVKSEKDEDFQEAQGIELDYVHIESARENRFNISQSMMQSNSSCRKDLESSSQKLENFCETNRPVVLYTNIVKPSSEVFVKASENASELNPGHLVKEESRDNTVSGRSRSSVAEGGTGNQISLINEALHSTQYLFTDMSEDSQESFDSQTGEWTKEKEWDAAEAFFGEEGTGEVQSFQVQDERHSVGLVRDQSTGVLPEEVKDVALKPFISSLSGGNCDAAYEPDIPEPFTNTGLLGGPSSLLFPCTVGRSLFNEGQAKSILSICMGSPSNVKSSPSIPQESDDPLAPFFPTKSACESEEHTKANDQGTIDISPLLCPARNEAEPQISTTEMVLHAGTSGPASTTQSYLKEDAAFRDERFEHLTHPRIIDINGQSSKPQVVVPYNTEDKEDRLFPLIFHQRPPDRGHLLMSYRELASNDKAEGGVYYGNVKDVLDRPTVMAGLIFDVKSREAAHLKPFTFGGASKRSNFEEDSRFRQYVTEENWDAQGDMDSVIGIPSHFDNDGTVSYLISPAKSPPTPNAVRQWVTSMQSVEKIKGAHVGGEQMFTMDANTGKLVPLVEIASAKNSQESSVRTDSSQEDADNERPASPKYDERHVLNLTHQSSTPPSRKFSQRNPVVINHTEHPSKTSTLAIATQQGFQHSKPPLVPCTAQTTGRCPLPPANTSEVQQKNPKNEVPGNVIPQDEQSKLHSGKSNPKSPRQWRDVSQMTAILPSGRSTPLSQAGFRDPASTGGGQQVTLMSIEVFAETRGDLLPDPRYDAIGCIVVVVHEDVGKADNINLTIVLIRDKEAHSSGRYVDGIKDCETIYLPDEVCLLKCFARLVHQSDPDMLLGWEIQGYSLGLLAERAANLGISLLKQLSRIPPVSTTSSEAFEKDSGLEEVANLFKNLPLETKVGDEPIIEDEWGRTHGSGLYVGGRIVLNIWRIMRGEVKLGIYSLEAVAEAVLRRRVPRVPWRTLTRWFSLGPGGGRFRCLEHFIDRARLNLQIMDQLDLMNRTAELARVFGIDFYSVFSRGSQFRVESMMARLAHTQNYILVSPTRQQVADQPAMECLPLVMEPESRFYTSPVIVLDFQSLYPSMIIAYNLCFSTCLGKLVPDNPKVLGVSKLSVQPGLLDSLKECMTITPNGVMFTPKEVRPGVLPRLLQEILSTRIMVKKAMKKLSSDQRVLQRVLNARQFALKLIANVTYGYTAAGFSGRMPCAEIADSIVQCGRLTLERAIDLVNSHPRWGARVVYGDTDSMFVLLEGRTREEAHAIGQEIAAAVTEKNPPPVALKMEKVYQPCVLLTKKRYVGYSYESPGQMKPTFDAKGIETIRRDSCPAVAKTLEHSLRTLFETQDLSQAEMITVTKIECRHCDHLCLHQKFATKVCQVKQYLQRQWGKILSGRISLQDFIFAKEVRLGTYSSRSPVLPPAAIVASKAMAVDPRAEPRYAERIPYVVVHGEPGARLVDMVVDPLTLIDQPSLRLHDTYYITKQIIPACQRIFMLVGVDLKTWFSEMPRVYRPPVSKRVSTLAVGTRSTKWDPEAGKKKRLGLKHGTIDQYYLSRHCTICGEFTRASQLLCSNCIQNPEAAAILLPGRTSRLERELKHLQAICRHCGGGDGTAEGNIACISLDCSVFFERRKVQRELQAAGAVSSDLGYYPPCLPELF